MKKYLLVILCLFLFTGCNKEYQMTCSGTIQNENDEYKLNVTIHYDLEDKVKALDYEMIYFSEVAFKNACDSSQSRNPKCDNLTVSYTENDEITRSFKKNDIINMLDIIGANDCK
jgi:hypothetical protein